MSAEKIVKQIELIRQKMGRGSRYDGYSLLYGGVKEEFHSDVNYLLSLYGEFLGTVKARHKEYLNELNKIDDTITDYFQTLLKTSDDETCFKLVNLGSGKISELLSFVNSLEQSPPEEKVSKASYDKLLIEKEDLKRTVEIMVQYKGLPELNNLLETAKDNAIPLDEYWVLALCASNLIEAVVNKKLEKLGEKAEGNFEDRYKKLCKVIKEREGREISQLLPSAVYKVRNKLDHASDSNRVTPKEAKGISKMVIEFINEVFQ
jgi:DNA mismatch repair ATPase MutS